MERNPRPTLHPYLSLLEGLKPTKSLNFKPNLPFLSENHNPNMASDCPAAFLPFHLLAIILSGLPAADFIRSGAVCKSWRRATADISHRPSSREIPYLMFPAGFHGGSSILFNLSSNKVSLIPIIGGQRCIGSCEGWVVTVDALAELRAFNPFTGARASLPSITTFSCIQGVRRNDNTGQIAGYMCKPNPHVHPYFRDLNKMCNRFYYKAIYFPSSKTAVVIHSDRSILAFARVGDISWTELDPISHIGFHDFILHEGRLFAVNRRGCLTAFNLDDGGGNRTSLIPIAQSGRFFDCDRYYLVESLDGDLLQVRRKTFRMQVSDMASNSDKGSGRHCPDLVRTLSFQIFKLEPHELRLKVKSLGAKAALFLGHNNSMAISTTGSPLKENCVYFTDSIVENSMTDPHSTRDIGVLNLEDGSIEPIFPYVSALASLTSPPPIWITPALS